MKKYFLLVLTSLLLISCITHKKSKELYNKARDIFYNADIAQWKLNSSQKNEVLDILDEVIQLEPSWWNPYREKIQILKIGSRKDYAKKVNDVYKLWLINNDLEGFSKFSYACSLYCANNESEALKLFNNLYYEYSKKNTNDEEKIIHIFSAIIVGNIDEEKLFSSALELFSEPMLENIENFFYSFKEDPKDTLWHYV